MHRLWSPYASTAQPGTFKSRSAGYVGIAAPYFCRCLVYEIFCQCCRDGIFHQCFKNVQVNLLEPFDVEAGLAHLVGAKLFRQFRLIGNIATEIDDERSFSG